jgi:hypothetical protein
MDAATTRETRSGLYTLGAEEALHRSNELAETIQVPKLFLGAYVQDRRLLANFLASLRKDETSLATSAMVVPVGDRRPDDTGGKTKARCSISCGLH